MLTVSEAKKLLLKNVTLLEAIRMDVYAALGFVLAEDIYAPIDLPQFSQSAMDGFAFYLDEHFEPSEINLFKIVGEVKAGDKPIEKLEPNTAVRIYTGAPIPENSNCVVMQEKVELEGDCASIPASALVKGSNIRMQGSQIKKGNQALPKGLLINPAAIGFLCTLGETKVNVIKKPLVSILATGNELKQPGSEINPGQIFESNTFTLDAALNQTDFSAINIQRVSDDEELTLRAIQNLIENSDVVIISGGISVGKYDLVKGALGKLGVKEIFYKVAQKPGKPIYIGKIENKIIFALPGNPAASLVCYYEYILPSLHKMSGHHNLGLKNVLLPLNSEYDLKADRDLFLKAFVENGSVSILDGQDSNMLKSFACSNAIVFLPAGSRKIKLNEKVETHLLP